MTEPKSTVLTRNSPEFIKPLQPPISLDPIHMYEIAL